MSTESIARQRYSLAFVLLLLGGLLFIMISSSLAGISDFENNLIVKNLLIEKTNWLRLRIGDRVFPNVLIGKDGWMEYTGDGNLNDYQNVIPIPQNGKKTLIKRLESYDLSFSVITYPRKTSLYERLSIPFVYLLFQWSLPHLHSDGMTVVIRPLQPPHTN